MTKTDDDGMDKILAEVSQILAETDDILERLKSILSGIEEKTNRRVKVRKRWMM